MTENEREKRRPGEPREAAGERHWLQYVLYLFYKQSRKAQRWDLIFCLPSREIVKSFCLGSPLSGTVFNKLEFLWVSTCRFQHTRLITWVVVKTLSLWNSQLHFDNQHPETQRRCTWRRCHAILFLIKRTPVTGWHLSSVKGSHYPATLC